MAVKVTGVAVRGQSTHPCVLARATICCRTSVIWPTVSDGTAATSASVISSVSSLQDRTSHISASTSAGLITIHIHGGLAPPRRRAHDADGNDLRAPLALLLLIFDRHPWLRELLVLAEVVGVHKGVFPAIPRRDKPVTARLVKAHDPTYRSHHSTTQQSSRQPCPPTWKPAVTVTINVLPQAARAHHGPRTHERTA